MFTYLQILNNLCYFCHVEKQQWFTKSIEYKYRWIIIGMVIFEISSLLLNHKSLLKLKFCVEQLFDHYPLNSINMKITYICSLMRTPQSLQKFIMGFLFFSLLSLQAAKWTKPKITLPECSHSTLFQADLYFLVASSLSKCCNCCWSAFPKEYSCWNDRYIKGQLIFQGSYQPIPTEYLSLYSLGQNVFVYIAFVRVARRTTYFIVVLLKMKLFTLLNWPWKLII